MNKILSFFILFICLTSFVKANNNHEKYYLDESSIEDSFNQAEDITSNYVLDGGELNQFGKNLAIVTWHRRLYSNKFNIKSGGQKSIWYWPTYCLPFLCCL
jgi:hypothetical protein